MNFGNCKIKVGKTDEIKINKPKGWDFSDEWNRFLRKVDAIDTMRYCYNDIINTMNYSQQLSLYSYAYQTIINKVIFNDPATIVYWTDGTKTVVKCSEDDVFDPEKGLAMAICKRFLGINYKKTFKEWIPEEEKETITLNFNSENIKFDISKLTEAFKNINTNLNKKD